MTEIFEADNSAPYYLKQERNYVFDDENDLRTNGSFLLTTGNVTTQDETPQIVGTVAGLGPLPRFRESYFGHGRTNEPPLPHSPKSSGSVVFG